MSKPAPRHAAQKRLSRGLAATGVASLALAGGAFTVASMGTASAATATGQYTCSVPDFSLTFKDPWTVSLTSNFPTTVEPGAKVAAPTITANVASGADAADLLRSTGNKTITAGTAVADYTVGSAANTANLTVSGTPITIPASGGINTVASGTGQDMTAPTTPGTLAVTAGNFTANLTTNTGFVAKISCVPANGKGISLGSITVGSAPTSTTTAPTTTTSKPTTPTSTTSTTSKPTTPTSTTSTAAPTSTTTAPTSTTTTAAPTSTTSKPTAPTSTTTSTTSTSAPATHTSTSAPTSTAPASSTSTVSSTAAPTSATATSTSTVVAPTSAATTTTPGTGPKVDTDYVGSSTANMAGIALAAAGFVALGGAVVAGRRND